LSIGKRSVNGFVQILRVDLIADTEGGLRFGTRRSYAQHMAWTERAKVLSGRNESGSAMSPALENLRVAQRKPVGLLATKSHWRRHSIDNYGGFQILDPYGNYVVAGLRFDMSPEVVTSGAAQWSTKPLDPSPAAP